MPGPGRIKLMLPHPPAFKSKIMIALLNYPGGQPLTTSRLITRTLAVSTRRGDGDGGDAAHLSQVDVISVQALQCLKIFMYSKIERGRRAI